MSFDSMIADEPRAKALRPAVENDTDAAGLPISNPIETLSNIAGRLVKESAGQVSAWMALGVQATYHFLTQEGRIENGWFLEVDGRRFRISGVRQKRMGKGTIADYWTYPLIEADRGNEML